MTQNHYEVLGLKLGAEADEIKAAYRRVALQHHPDRSNDPKSLDIFLAAKEAYDTLTDSNRKVRYDAFVAYSTNAPPSPKSRPIQKPPDKAPDRRLQELKILFARGKLGEAEELAKKLSGEGSTEPLPYTILGDIYRSKGQNKDASRMYALAVQMDPSNPIYQRRHEEMVYQQTSAADAFGGKPRPLSLFPAAVLTVTATAVISIYGSQGSPEIRYLLLGICGVVVGASAGLGLALGKWNDRFVSLATTTQGKPSRLLFVFLASVFCYWFGLVAYILLSFRDDAFAPSGSKFFTLTTIIALSCIAPIIIVGTLGPYLAILIAGNSASLGALIGWVLGDTLRAPNE